MIGLLKDQRIQKGGMQFGVELPGTFKEAVIHDEKNGNSLWQDFIKKQINNSRISFKLLKKHGKPPVGYTDIFCRLVFELNLDMSIKY